MGDPDIKKYAESIDDPKLKEHLLGMTVDPEVQPVPNPFLAEPIGASPGYVAPSTEIMPSSRLTKFEQQMQNIEAQGAKLTSIAEFHEKDVAVSERIATQFGEYWGMTIGALNGVANFLAPKDRTYGVTWDDENYEELIAASPKEHRSAIFEATDLGEATQIRDQLAARDEILTQNTYSMGGAAPYVNMVGMMSDPGMWITGFGGMAVTARGMKLLSTTKKAAGALAGAGMMGSVEATIGYSYASLAQAGDASITDEDVAHWAIWGGLFGAALGGAGGALGALKRANVKNIETQVRVRHSQDLMNDLGPNAHNIFNNVVNHANPNTVRITMEELVEAELSIFRNPKSIESRLGLDKHPGRITGVIDDLSPQGYTRLLEGINKGLELKRVEYLAQKLRRLAEEGHVLALTKKDIEQLRGTIPKGEITAIEVAQARLLQQTDTLGETGLNKILEGQAAILSPDEIKWLVQNTPEVFGPKGVDLNAVMKGKDMRMADYRKMHAGHMAKRQATMHRLANREFQAGDIVMTTDGRVGRIATVSDGVGKKIQLESLELMEIRKQLKETTEALAKAEGKTKGMTRANARANIEHLKARVDELTADSMRMADDVFDAPVAASARFLLSEELEKITFTKWGGKGTDVRYKSKTVSKKLPAGGTYDSTVTGAVRQFAGRLFGKDVVAKGSQTLEGSKIGGGKQWWKITVGGRKGKGGFEIYSERWWENELKTGRIKADSQEYLNRTVIDDTGSIPHIKRQLEEVARRETMSRYSKEVIKRNDELNISLNRADDPPNVLHALAEGNIPDSIRAILPKDFVDDVLIDWAKAHKDVSGETLEALLRGEAADVVHTVKASDAIAAAQTAGRLDPVIAVLSGKFGENVWGLTHEIGAVRRLYSLTYGSWFALTDPITGMAIAAGGASDSILAGGAMNYNRMHVKSVMAPFVDVMLESTRKYKKIAKYNPLNPWNIGKADEEFQKFVKAFIEDDVLTGVPRGAEKLVRDSAQAYRTAVGDVLEWAKKNGVDELTNVMHDKKYFPRFRNHAAMERIIKDKMNGGPAVLDELLTRSLMEASPQMAKEAAELMANKIRRYYMSPSGSRMVTDNMLGVKAKDVEEFVDTLDGILRKGEKNGGLNPTERTALIAKLGPSFEVTKHAKHRIPLNMQTALKNPIDGKMLRVSDLFETNVTAVLERYTIDMVSTAQKRAILKEFTTEAYQPKTLEGLIDNIVEAAGNSHIPAGGIESHLELVRKFLDNEPKFTRGAFTSTLAVARQYATILKLPGFVAAQIPEAYTATFSTGLFRRMHKSMPALEKMRRGALDGSYSLDDASKYVHMHLGMGNVEHDLSLLYAHHELLEEGSTLVSGKVIGRLYGMQSHLIPRISRISGFRQINVYSDLVAHRNFVDLLIDASKTNNKTIFSQKRLASLGIDQNDFDEILGAFRQEGVINSERMGARNVLTLNSDKLPAGTAAKFRTMSAANIRQTVQRTHTWDMPKWLIESPTGELLTQFRTFSMSAMSNHFARNVQAMDRFAFSNVSTMFFGGLVTHWSMSYLNFHDQPDKLRESLETTNWVKGALIRAGFMGMIPDLVDAPLSLVTGQTLFSPSNKAMLLSVPVFDMLRDVTNATQTVYKKATGQPTHGAEQWQFRKITPLTNLLYWRVLSEYFIPDSPL